jgi:hypothetical protein
MANAYATLASYGPLVKTSGSTGLHVLIPLGCQCRHDQSRSLGELLARILTAELPAITTLARQVSRREGKVYVDYLQEARVDMLRTHGPAAHTGELAEGVVVVRHEVQYVAPLGFRFQPVDAGEVADRLVELAATAGRATVVVVAAPSATEASSQGSPNQRTPPATAAAAGVGLEVLLEPPDLLGGGVAGRAGEGAGPAAISTTRSCSGSPRATHARAGSCSGPGSRRARRRADRESHLPGECGDGHVAPDQPVVGEVGDQAVDVLPGHVGAEPLAQVGVLLALRVERAEKHDSGHQ